MTLEPDDGELADVPTDFAQRQRYGSYRIGDRRLPAGD
jgi:hypothetical protein